MKYHYKPSGKYMLIRVTGYNEEQLAAELLSLQNKGIAGRATVERDGSFSFYAAKPAVMRAFYLQALYTLWNNERALSKYRGRRGGFIKLVQHLARKKFNSMVPLSRQTSSYVPVQYSVAL